MGKFNCKACGTCCTKLNQSKIYQELDRGDGTCIYFNTKDRLCTIYDERPMICRIDKMYELYFKNKYSKKDYYKMNYDLCLKWEKERRWSFISDTKKQKDKDDVLKAGLGAAAYDNVDKYGEGAAEFIKDLPKLEKISNYKVNPDFEYQNLSQQSGNSAEVLASSKTNARNIIEGNSERKVRTDDLDLVNHPKYDHVVIDGEGNFYLQDGSQMKFKFPEKFDFNNPELVKKSASKLANQISGKKWQAKYKDIPIEVPSDMYEDVKAGLNQKVNSLYEQSSNLEQKGNYQKANEIKNRAREIKKTKDNLKKSNVSSKEAYIAAQNPKYTTLKNVAKIANEAGKEQAKAGAIISGVVSCSKNMVAIIRGEKDLKDATIDLSKDITKGAGTSYGIAASGTALKSVMQTSNISMVKTLSKTNMPALIATTTVQVGSSLKKYIKGDINELELMEELGEKGTGMMAASMGAAVGTAIFPGVGTVVGAMVGYMTSSQIYQSTMNVLAEEKLSNQKREFIKKISEEALKTMQREQEELKEIYGKYYKARENYLNNCLSLLDEAVANNNIDLFTASLNKIAISFGETLEFKNFQEFDNFMKNEETVFDL